MNSLFNDEQAKRHYLHILKSNYQFMKGRRNNLKAQQAEIKELEIKVIFLNKQLKLLKRELLEDFKMTRQEIKVFLACAEEF